jgi:hypothetical protein
MVLYCLWTLHYYLKEDGNKLEITLKMLIQRGRANKSLKDLKWMNKNILLTQKEAKGEEKNTNWSAH